MINNKTLIVIIVCIILLAGFVFTTVLSSHVKGKSAYPLSLSVVLGILLIPMLITLTARPHLSHYFPQGPLPISLMLTACAIIVSVNIVLLTFYAKFVTTYNVYRRMEEVCGGKGPLEKETLRYQFRNFSLLTPGIRLTLASLLYLALILLILSFTAIIQASVLQGESTPWFLVVPIYTMVLLCCYGLSMLLHPNTYKLPNREYKDDLKKVHDKIVSMGDKNNTLREILKERMIQRVLSEKELGHIAEAKSYLENLRHSDSYEWVGYIRSGEDQQTIQSLFPEKDFNLMSSTLSLLRLGENRSKLRKLKNDFGFYFIVVFTVFGYFLFHAVSYDNSTRIMFIALLIAIVSMIAFWFGAIAI